MAQASDIRHVARILDSLARSLELDGDAQETEFDAAIKLLRESHPEALLRVLDRAVGRSKARSRASIYVLGELSDCSTTAAKRLGMILHTAAVPERNFLLQIIGERKLTALAPNLNKVLLEDPDESCRRSALRAAGALAQDVNWSVVMKLARACPTDHDVIVALINFGREEGRPLLRTAFDRPVGPAPFPNSGIDVDDIDHYRRLMDWQLEKSTRTFAAWGLAKLGDKQAIAFLGRMLDDPDVADRYSSRPGESLRAAQALSDVFELPFKWDKNQVASVRQWWLANKGRIVSDG